MVEKILLNLKDKENKIYEEIAKALDPHKDKEPFSVEFIVEGALQKPIISIRYPAKKLVKLETKRKNSARYGNLFDFVVVIYDNGKEELSGFTFEKILRDFEENKKDSEEFWGLLKEIYYKNKLSKEPPKLKGIDSKLFLLAIKWIWLQEDFNYKMKWDEVKSPTRYKLISKRGNSMSRGAGRAKFFGAMILLKNNFTIEEVKKIIPMYA